MTEDECIICCEDVYGMCIRCQYPVCFDHLSPKSHYCDKRIQMRCLECRTEFGEYINPPYSCKECGVKLCSEHIINLCRICAK